MAANQKRKSNSDWGWPLVILSFCFGLWPIGLLLLFSKLFAEDEKKPAQTAPPLQGTAEQTNRPGGRPRPPRR